MLCCAVLWGDVQGRLAEVAELQGAVLRMLPQVLDPDHPLVARSCTDLARVLQASGTAAGSGGPL